MSTHTRVRGFAPWSPRAATLELLAQVKAVLVEYADHLPLTVRQIFYRLVGAYGYAKTEEAYDNLGEHLNRARRAKLIPFEHIRDDGIIAHDPPGWSSVDSLIRTFRHEAEHFTLDRQQGQSRRLIVMCEAGGMVPQLERVAHPYSVEVISKGGFDSTTGKHALACKAADYGTAVEILHIGDHDPSGVHIYSSLDEDVRAFAAAMGAAVEFTRLAVLPEQVERAVAGAAPRPPLPTAPAKPTDRRSFAGINGDTTATVQAEAIPPDELALILQAALDARIDRGAYLRELAAEQRARASLAGWLDGFPEP